MVLDNILPWELDPTDRIRQLALKDRLDMKASGAHLIEDKIHRDHKVLAPFLPELRAASTSSEFSEAERMELNSEKRLEDFPIETCLSRGSKLMLHTV